MGFLDSKPYTAVTETIERLTRDEYEEDDLTDIPELIDVITIRPTGPTEAARAIRKKLKYGTPHKQLRALALLDALLQNGNSSDFKLFYKDEMLLERLRVLATDSFTDQTVKRRCTELFLTWNQQFADKKGYSAVASLYKQLPRKTRKPKTYTYEEDEEEGQGSNSSARVAEGTHRGRGDDLYGDGEDDREARVRAAREREREREKSRDTERKHKKSLSFGSRGGGGSSGGANIHVTKVESTEIKLLLADANSASTNLSNCLRRLNREVELSTENKECTKAFNECRAIRKKILRFIHGVVGDEYLGALIHANEELVAALKLYDEMSIYPNEDSDSDYENDDWMQNNATSEMSRMGLSDNGMSSPRSPQARSPPGPMSPKSPKPPRPAKPSYLIDQMRSKHADEDDDDANPFGDSHRTD